MDGRLGCWSLPPFQSGSELLQQEQGDLPISSQVQEQLKQIYLLMDMEEHEHAEAAPSSQSSTFHSSASPDEAASLAQWQCYQYQMEMAVAPPTTAAGSNCNQVQVQHVLSERKRREKLNDSFKALKAVLPPGPKKDKASILIRARDYVNTLKSRVSELEERNRRLVELQHHCNNGGDRDEVSDGRIEVDIDRAAVVEETSQEYYNLKIVVRSGCNATDAVVVILECLKGIGEVRLEAMDTGSGATTLTLQMKTSRCDDNFLKESVIKSVKGAIIQSKIETP
nr:unnamed protein product [Digitaria exilis]